MDIAEAMFKMQEQIYNLKAENERLKEEIEIRDNLSEKFRTEALSWANIANEYQKDKIKLKQILQGIKDFLEVPEFYLYGKEIIHDRIMQKITNAEE